MNQRTKTKPADTDRQEAAENRSVVDLRDHDAVKRTRSGGDRGTDPSAPIPFASTATAELKSSRFAVDWAPSER